MLKLSIFNVCKKHVYMKLTFGRIFVLILLIAAVFDLALLATGASEPPYRVVGIEASLSAYIAFKVVTIIVFSVVFL